MMIQQEVFSRSMSDTVLIGPLKDGVRRVFRVGERARAYTPLPVHYIVCLPPPPPRTYLTERPTTGEHTDILHHGPCQTRLIKEKKKKQSFSRHTISCEIGSDEMVCAS